MAIIPYQSEAGENLWKAYVSVKSKVNPALRIQRWKFGLISEKQAEREEATLKRECHEEILKKEAQGSTWGALVDLWEEYLSKDHAEKLNEATRSDYISTVKKYTNSWWKRPASSITRADVVECLEQMKVNSSSISYQNKTKVILNRIFVYGIENRIVKGMDRSPTYGISLGREEEKKPEILGILEIKKLLESARDFNHPWYPVWAMAIITGMRNGELFALLWTDVDFENREISVTKSFNCRRRIVKSTKAGYWRTVPISNELMTLLEALKANAGNRAEVLPRLDRWYHGEQAKRLRQFCLEIGLPSVKFHTLRACFATQLIRNGVPPIQLQKICGWKDLETMQRYIRLAGIETKGATESLKVLPDREALALAATSSFPTKTAGLSDKNQSTKRGTA